MVVDRDTADALDEAAVEGVVVLADPSLDLPLRPWMIKSPRATGFEAELEAVAGLLALSVLDELANVVLFESVVAECQSRLRRRIMQQAVAVAYKSFRLQVHTMKPYNTLPPRAPRISTNTPTWRRKR